MKKALIAPLLLLATIGASAQVPAYVPTNNLVGWYPFNGNANNEAAPGSLIGTVNGATLTSDRFGAASKAYYFDGIANNITIDTTFFNTGWSNYTIAFWANTDTIGNYHNGNNNQVMFNTIPHNGIGIGNNWLGSGKFSLWVNSNPPVGTWDILSNKRSQNNTTAHVWQHIAFVKHNDTSYSFYLNGQLDTTYNNSMTMAVSSYCKMMLGSTAPPTSPETFWGKLDDYGIWNRALTQCEINKLYKSSTFLYITSQPMDVITWFGSSLSFHITDTGTGNTYQWQVSSGSGFSNVVAGIPYSGITTPTLTISTAPTTFSGNKYRCIVMGTSCVDTSSYANLILVPGGIHQNNKNITKILISPNPTTGDFYITGADKVNVRIFDNTGRVVKKEVNTGRISIAAFPAGLYIIELTDDDGKLLLHDKLIKQ